MKRVRLNLEFLFKASPAMLFNFFTTPSRLVRWFCDEAKIYKNNYSFIWEDSEETATLIESEENHFLRFVWDDAENEEEYFEFKMSQSAFTGETLLEITDFCDENEVKYQTQLWESQIEQLRLATGG